MFKFLRIALLSAGALFALGAYAQPGPDEQSGSPDQGDQADPPSRVARLAFIRGAVSFVPAGENDWVEAQINRPLITGDKLWTDSGSRAELEIGSSAIRIDEQTSFDFLNLDDDTAQIELTQGALNLRVRRLYDNQVYEIDTPTLAFVVNRVGEYRVSVTPDGNATIVSVMRGGGDAYGEGGARFRVEEGQSVTFNDSQLRDYYTDSLPPPDAFDEFIAQRDGRWDRARSRAYVSEDVIGYEDLDDNGDWADVPEYGHVWYPTAVAVGWAPYHYGHWGWVGAYGWTWIDDAPWGFAPFHYGRWAYIGNRWGWCPGPREVRPYYAPALVAFIGGGGVSVGIGIGGPVGWFPLGPRDVWFPGYHVSRNYFTRVNVSNTVVNTTIINNYYGNYSRGTINYGEINYHNRGIAGAVVAVPAAAFVGARPVHTSAIAVNRETFANARVSSFAAIAPTRTSLVASSARAGKAPPEAVVNRRIVAASKPPAPVASFASREALLQKNPGQPLSKRELRVTNVQAQGQGGVAARTAIAERQNVKVVTNTGVPARTPAAPLVTRGNVNAVNANNGNRKGGPEDRRAGGAASNNAGQQTRTLNNAGGRAVGNAIDKGGQGQNKGQNEHVESSRFVRGNAGGNNAAAGGNAANANAATLDRGRGNVDTRKSVTGGNVERQGASNALGGNNAAASGNNRSNQTFERRGGNVNTQGQGRPTITTDNSARQATGNAVSGNNAAGGDGRGKDNAYRQERTLRSNQSVSGAGGDNSQGKGNARVQEYRQPQQQQQQYHPPQEVHSAPVYQQQQQPVQRGQQPVQPQVQRGQPQGQGNNNRGNDNRGNDKKNKDDDKKKGGGGGR